MGTYKTALCVGTALAALALAGCKSDGVGSTDSISTGTSGGIAMKVTDNPNAAYADPKDTSYDANKALDPSNTKTQGKLSASNATSSAVVVHADFNDPDNSTVSVADPQKFSIAKNKDGSVTVTLNGESETYTSADMDGELRTNSTDPITAANSEGYVKTDGKGVSHAIYTHSADNLAQLASDKQYAHIWEYFWTNDGWKTAKQGFAVVGVETNPDDLPKTAVANYKGKAFARVYDAKGDPSTYRVFRGATNMTADFGAKTMSGSITQLTAEDRPDTTRQNVAGAINMESTAIQRNGYAGKLSLDATAKSALGVKNTDGSTYSGRFYGPGAAETAGVLGLNVANTDGSASVGYGRFSAKKQ